MQLLQITLTFTHYLFSCLAFSVSATHHAHNCMCCCFVCCCIFSGAISCCDRVNLKV